MSFTKVPSWYAIERDGQILLGFQGAGKTPSFRTWPSQRNFHHPKLNPQELVNTTLRLEVRDTETDEVVYAESLCKAELE